MPFLPKAIVFLLIAGAMAFFLDREEQRGSFDTWDSNYRSWLIANRDSEEEILKPSVTFLQIDDPGARVFGSWPLGPVDHSILIDNLSKNEPKVIAVEPVLRWLGGTDVVLLNSLRNVLLRLDQGSVLLGAELLQDPSGESIAATTLSLFPDLQNVEGDVGRIPEFSRPGAIPEPALTSIGPRLGFTRIDLGDAEAKRKRDSFTVPLLARHGEKVIPSFILMAIIMEAGETLANVSVSLEERVIRVGDGGGLEIPIDRGGRLSVHTGIRQAISRHNADILLLDGDESIRDQLKPEERESLLSRIVILGTNDATARKIELPRREEKISQAELFAMAIATIQAKRFIQKVSPLVEYGIWAGLALVGLLILRAHRKRRVAMWWGVLLILYIVGSLMLFQYTGQWASLVVPMGIIASVLLVGLILPAARVQEEVS